MAKALDHPEPTPRYPWYWDDHTDYDCNEAFFTPYHQNQALNEKHSSIYQNQRLRGTKRPFDGHNEDALLAIVQGDLHQGEMRGSDLRRSPSFVPLLTGSNLNLTGDETTTQAFSSTMVDPRRCERHFPKNSDHIQPTTEASIKSGFDSSALPSSVRTDLSSPLNVPSSSPPKRKPRKSLLAAAFDEIGLGVKASDPLQHLRMPTCTGNAEMVIDKRKRGWGQRERERVQSPEEGGTATSRFPLNHPHSFPLDSTIVKDMECILEEVEDCVEGVCCTGSPSSTGEAVDGGERGRSGYSQSRSGQTNGGRSSNEYGYSNGRSNNGYSGARGRTGLNGRGRDDDEDDDERRSSGDGHLDYYFSGHFTTSGEEDDLEEDESDEESSSEYAKGSMHHDKSTCSYHHSSSSHRQKDRRTSQSHQTSSSNHTDSDEDDVPLAQSHPTALRAQQSIRIKDRQRRKERKLEKAREKSLRGKTAELLNSGISNGSSANAASGLGGMSSTQEAMLHASSPASLEAPSPSFATMKIMSSPVPSSLSNAVSFPTSPNPDQTTASLKLGDCTTLPSSVRAGTVRLRAQRGRTITIAGNGSNLPDVQQDGSAPPTPNSNQFFATEDHNMGIRKMESQNTARTVRPMRSFHAQRVNNAPQQGAQDRPMNSHPVPVLTNSVTPVASLTRSHTRARSQSNTFPQSIPVMASVSAPPLPSVPPAVPVTTSRARSRSRPPPPHNPYTTDEFGQLSHSTVEPMSRRSTESRRVASGSGGARSSLEHTRERVEVPPVELMPALPPSLASHHPSAALETRQLRVYISTKQRFVMVEITSITNAGDLVGMVKAKDGLPDVQSGAGSAGDSQGGGWLVWEINVDLGMERPIRPFEQLVEVSGSWNKEKTENVFMLKWTPGWEKMLRREVIPSSAPTYSGYLEYEVRRGKWNKRWLVLKDHCLYISKRDNCKDQVLLCSLSNFDIYHVINPPSKLPKEYAFGMKSMDKMSLFEDTNDYMHLFSCRGSEGEKWVQRIRIARSYVLHQERNILFAPPPTLSGPLSSPVSGGGLSRAGTTRRRVPTQPLVQVADNEIFAKGSLLRSQAQV